MTGVGRQAHFIVGIGPGLQAVSVPVPGLYPAPPCGSWLPAARPASNSSHIAGRARRRYRA